MRQQDSGKAYRLPILIVLNASALQLHQLCRNQADSGAVCEDKVQSWPEHLCLLMHVGLS